MQDYKHDFISAKIHYLNRDNSKSVLCPKKHGWYCQYHSMIWHIHLIEACDALQHQPSVEKIIVVGSCGAWAPLICHARLHSYHWRDLGNWLCQWTPDLVWMRKLALYWQRISHTHPNLHEWPSFTQLIRWWLVFLNVVGIFRIIHSTRVIAVEKTFVVALPCVCI